MTKDPREIKTLFVYQDHAPGAEVFYQAHLATLRAAGFAVEGFCITLDPPARRFTFPVLDRMWRSGDRRLRELYAELKRRAAHCEVLILFNGANLHPEFLPELDTFNAYMCFDDPECSQFVSRPVARFFDACFVANIAALDQYRGWGCRNVFFRPSGFHASHVAHDVDPTQIGSDERELDVCIFCERETAWRRDRLEFLEKEIPSLYGRGRGWPAGFVEDHELLDVYRRSKIGINLHNSTGPINCRTYALPASGLMQICDNKYFTGQLFDLGKEVVGYNDIEEVPDLVRFYLANDAERIRIASAGYQRVHRDYNEVEVFRRQMATIAELL